MELAVREPKTAGCEITSSRLPNASFGQTFVQLRTTPTLKVGPYKLDSVVTPLCILSFTETISSRLDRYYSEKQLEIQMSNDSNHLPVLVTIETTTTTT